MDKTSTWTGSQLTKRCLSETVTFSRTNIRQRYQSSRVIISQQLTFCTYLGDHLRWANLLLLVACHCASYCFIIMNILFRTKCNKQCKWKYINQCSETRIKLKEKHHCILHSWLYYESVWHYQVSLHLQNVILVLFASCKLHLRRLILIVWVLSVVSSVRRDTERLLRYSQFMRAAIVKYCPSQLFGLDRRPS